MKNKKINILLLVKNKFHEVLLSNELKSNFSQSTIFSVQSKQEALRTLSTEIIQTLIVDFINESHGELCDLHQIHLATPDMPIIALVENNSEKFLKKLLEIGVTEILQKNETFYVAIPKMLQEILTRKISTAHEDTVGQYIKQSEHQKITSQALSHEINNPLMTILGITELILDEQYKYENNLIEKINAIQESALRIQKSTHRRLHLNSPQFQKNLSRLLFKAQKQHISKKSKV